MKARATMWGAYRDITLTLKARILAGEFPPGSALPSESALCTEYGVARNTLRRALDQLAKEGVIAVRPGRGRIVLASGETVGQSVPLYRSLAAYLRGRIESGELAPGDAVPSEAVLAEEYGVARGTVRHGLAELEGAGLIESLHGKGRFVRRR